MAKILAVETGGPVGFKASIVRMHDNCSPQIELYSLSFRKAIAYPKNNTVLLSPLTDLSIKSFEGCKTILLAVY
ncbi:hypothetical protein [Gloeothece citriformis]|uniref:hypothetical protein n=1 Tax=Gloeothece citriformis TaxID=2546356 RepID=UPI000319DFB9|nr:hypothetical protein [Gloeothece citriformis]